MKKIQPFTILSRETLIAGPYLPVERQHVRLPDGQLTDWFVHTGGDVVLVVPLLPDGRVVLQQQYKHGRREVITEIVAGMIDQGEEPLTAGQRELREEIGLQSTDWQLLQVLAANPTASIMRYHIYLAQGCTPCATGTQWDAAEVIHPLIVPDLPTATQTLRQAPQTSAAGLLAVLLAQTHLMPQM